MKSILAGAGILSTGRPLSASVTHTPPEWKNLQKGLDFCLLTVHDNKQALDKIAVLKVNPQLQKIRVFNSFNSAKTVVYTMEEWQKQTGATAMINSAQYMADPYYMPCAIVLTDGKQKGLPSNKNVRGMLVAEPKNSKLPKADLLDFDYDTFRLSETEYTQGVQHWPILLDRNEKIRVLKTPLRANRSVVAKDLQGNILFFTTERDYFTLYNFGLFLKESNKRKDRGFQIHTAMNLDGGKEATMVVKSSGFTYLTPQIVRVRFPGVIGIFPR